MVQLCWLKLYQLEDPLCMSATDSNLAILPITQVKSGTIFDNFLITDDEKYAEEVGNETWGKTKDPEKKMKEEVCAHSVTLLRDCLVLYSRPHTLLTACACRDAGVLSSAC